MQKYYSQADIVSMLTFIGHPNRNAVGRLFKLPKNSRREKIDEYSKIFSYKEICKTLRVGLLGLPKRFLTIEDVMYLLNVDRGTVLLLIDKGFLKNYYPGEEEKGRRILFHPKEIENYFSDISYFIWNRRKIKDEEIEDEEKTEGREILRGKVEDKEKIEGRKILKRKIEEEIEKGREILREKIEHLIGKENRDKYIKRIITIFSMPKDSEPTEDPAWERFTRFISSAS
jgi:hypothetical protein